MLTERAIADPLGDCSYIPYEEVRLRWSGSGTEFLIETPWMELSFDVEPDIVERIKSISEHLHSPESRRSVSDIFKSLEAYPLAYVTPRRELLQLSKTYAEPVMAGWQEAASTPQSLAQRIVRETPSNLTISIQEQACEWSWAVEDILAKSALGEGLYDPLAAYAVMTRRRLATEMKFGQRQQLFALLRELLRDNEECFLRATSLIVYQTYYVTLKCEDSISPAFSSFPQASSQIAGFLADERGHDGLIRQTLRALGEAKANGSEVVTSVKILMMILRFAAAKHNFALCNIIPCFEGSPFMEDDPLAALLRKSSQSSAAAGLELHYKLNKDGNHYDIGKTLARRLPPVDAQTISVAARLTELTVLYQELMAAELISRIKSYV